MHYSRSSLFGSVFAERCNCIVGDLLKKPVFEKSESNCVDKLPTITKQYNNRVHFSKKINTKTSFFEKERRLCLQKIFWVIERR